MIRVHSQPAEWLPVSIASSDADLEVCVIDYEGIVHALAFPCHRNKHLQCSIKETRTYKKVIDMDQTALLTNCSNLHESIRRKQFFRSSLPKNLPVLTASESVQLKMEKDGEDRN